MRATVPLSGEPLFLVLIGPLRRLAAAATEHRDENSGAMRILADRAYSHNSTGARLRQMRIQHTIPEKTDQIAWRKARGSAGGRPPAFDPAVYRERNTVERSFNRLKQWRGIATRYDKYATTYLGGVLLASLIVHHRTHLPDTA